MSARLPCPPAPGPLEEFAVQFDPLFHTLAQRHGFRTYLAGLLMPRDRSKTLTALVGRRTTGPGTSGRGPAAAILSIRSELERGRDHRATTCSVDAGRRQRAVGQRGVGD